MRTATSPDDIRQLIWNTAYKDKRLFMASYYSIMEFLCQEYDAEFVEALRTEDYDSFLEDLEAGRWKLALP